MVHSVIVGELQRVDRGGHNEEPALYAFSTNSTRKESECVTAKGDTEPVALLHFS